MGTTAAAGDLTIYDRYDEMVGSVNKAASNVKNAIDTALAEDDLDPMTMLDLQYKMGNYNAMVEAASSVTKGLTDTAKTLAQRAGG